MRRSDYSRSDRIGELYDEIFYRPVWNESLFGGKPRRRGETPIELRELLIHPPGEGPTSGRSATTAGARAACRCCS